MNDYRVCVDIDEVCDMLDEVLCEDMKKSVLNDTYDESMAFQLQFAGSMVGYVGDIEKLYHIYKKYLLEKGECDNG